MVHDGSHTDDGHLMWCWFPLYTTCDFWTLMTGRRRWTAMWREELNFLFVNTSLPCLLLVFHVCSRTWPKTHHSLFCIILGFMLVFIMILMVSLTLGNTFPFVRLALGGKIQGLSFDAWCSVKLYELKVISLCFWWWSKNTFIFYSTRWTRWKQGPDKVILKWFFDSAKAMK